MGDQPPAAGWRASQLVQLARCSRMQWVSFAYTLLEGARSL